MPQTPHIERHFTGSETVKDIVIGIADGLTVPFALAAGLSGACDLSWVSKSPIPGERLPVQERLQGLTSQAALSRSVRTWFFSRASTALTVSAVTTLIALGGFGYI